jgi:class 3 adenylate cyclase
MSTAAPGEILVSSTVPAVMGGAESEEFQSRGSHRLKGVPGDWELFAARAPES